MIERTAHLHALTASLRQFPVVAILGPRQIGKTTLNCYERALGAEPLAEVLYQWLIACYGRLGSSAEALGVCSIFAALLHTTPSPDTEALVEAIRRPNGSSGDSLSVVDGSTSFDNPPHLTPPPHPEATGGRSLEEASLPPRRG